MNMNRILVLSVFTLTLILSACSGTKDEVPSTEVQSNGEATNLENENEALRKELAEKENKELKAELAAADEEKEKSNEEKNENLSTEKVNDESDAKETPAGNRSELYFDLNDENVKNQFIGTEYGNKDGSFEQSVITEGMSQTEVEEKYGTYDFSMHVEGAAPAIYGNLAVIYSQYYPYGTDGDPARTDINPDTNYVQSVYYFADISPDEMIAILGEPDDYNDGQKSMNGLPYYVYSGTGKDGRYYTTGAETINQPGGNTVSLINREIHEENPYDTDTSTSSNDDLYFSHDNDESQSYPFTLTTEDDSYKYEVFTNYMNDYIPFLTVYYNGDSDDVLDYVTGNALSKLQENRASDYFADHENFGVKMISIEQLSLQKYRVTIERNYSHANSSGPATTQVTYTVVDGDGHLQITDFE